VSADAFSAPPLPENGLHLKAIYGASLTPEEQQTWDAYRAADEAAERRRDLLGLIDIEALIEEGIEEPEMLIPDRIVSHVHQTWHGPKESSKTWIALLDAVTVMRAGGTVLWIDKEMGRALFFDRLLNTLGVPGDLLINHFIYAEYPSLDLSEESKTMWRTLIEARKPTLLVTDAQTEVLADAALNENSGTDIARWANAYLNPALRAGGTTLMIDHTGHDEQGRARGSGQKGNAAKVELGFNKLQPFDRETVGLIEITRTKNTAAAPIPEVQRWKIGGTPFTWEPVSTMEMLLSDDSRGGYDATRDRVSAFIQQHAGDIEVNPEAPGVTITGLREGVTGKATHIGNAAPSLAEEAFSPVYSKLGSTGKPRFYWSQAKADAQPRLPKEESGAGGGTG
jgi:hypothetical protein